MQNPKFKADMISGVEGCCFALSVVLEVSKPSEKRRIFNFPFYALSIDLKKDKSDEWIDEKEYNKVCDNIISYIKDKGLNYFEELSNIVEKESSKFKEEVQEIIKKIPHQTNEELIKTYNSFIKDYIYYFHLGAISFPYETILSDRLSNSLSKRYSNTAEILEPLLKTNYKSFMIESEHLLSKIKNNSKNNTLIKEYLDNFFFMKVNYEDAPVITEKILKEDVKSLIEHKEKITKKDKITDLTEDERIIVDLMRITEKIRDQRKKTNLLGNYALFRFVDEVEKRTNIPRNIIKRAFWNEFEILIKFPDKIKPILEKREFASVVLDKDKAYYLDYNALEENIKIDATQKTIKGTPASKGYAKGIIKIINGPRDFNKMNKSDIIVTKMTRPEFLPVMKKASAIVTDEGGLTCHAAIIARELGIPCIIGTKVSARLLNDGDEVEVDANKGIVKILKKAN